MESATAQLVRHLTELDESLRSAAVTVTEDRPEGPSPRLVDGLEERLTDAIDGTRQALTVATMVLGLTTDDIASPATLHRSLAACHTHVLEVSRIVRDDILDPTYQRDLHRLAQERSPGHRGDEWSGWVQVVHTGLIACRGLLAMIDEDLLACWVDIGGRAGQINVSVQAVGQRFAAAAASPPRTGSAEVRGR